MKFIAIADTDIGIVKEINQDSVLVKHATTDDGEIMLAIVCDGMGGLAKGELASATVVTAFSEWFYQVLPYKIETLDLSEIANEWISILKELAERMLAYGKKLGKNLGTTFSAILFWKENYLIVHVGDSRIYKVDNTIQQLTTDHTFVAREIACGRMTEEQAKTDKRRNMLLQCIGASKKVEPEVLFGKITTGTYIVCSDGFRHRVTSNELQKIFEPKNMLSKSVMKKSARNVIELVKKRNERDNISVIVIKVD